MLDMVLGTGTRTSRSRHDPPHAQQIKKNASAFYAMRVPSMGVPELPRILFTLLIV